MFIDLNPEIECRYSLNFRIFWISSSFFPPSEYIYKSDCFAKKLFCKASIVFLVSEILLKVNKQIGA